MKIISKILLTMVPVLLLVSCSSTKEPMSTGDTGVSSTTGQPIKGGPGTGAEAIAAPDDGSFRGDPLDDPSSLLAKRVIYFDFDKSDVRDEFRSIIRVHASYLAGNPSASIILEGHADERGSREYNIALGERRAIAVQNMIKVLGGPSRNIEAISYGEERPVAFGHDESSWNLNRRVEIIYTEH